MRVQGVEMQLIIENPNYVRQVIQLDCGPIYLNLYWLQPGISRGLESELIRLTSNVTTSTNTYRQTEKEGTSWG